MQVVYGWTQSLYPEFGDSLTAKYTVKSCMQLQVNNSYYLLM